MNVKKKEDNVPVTVRVTPKAYDVLARIAEARYMSVNLLMVAILEAYADKVDVEAEVKRGLGVEKLF